MLAHRSVQIARLTKAAASDTAAENFKHHSVVDNIHKRHNHFIKNICAVKLLYDAFAHFFRNAAPVRLYRKYRQPVVRVCHIVK